MKQGLLLTEIEAIHSELVSIDSQIKANQSVHDLIDLGGQLTAWLAFTGEQMAIAKSIWRSETAKAYDTFVFSKMAQGMTITPTMANKYAEARSGNHEAEYEFCERVNRSITHTLDFLRTAISALKEEQKAYSYGGAAI
jgi:hypothetical protein